MRINVIELEAALHNRLKDKVVRENTTGDDTYRLVSILSVKPGEGRVPV